MHASPSDALQRYRSERERSHSSNPNPRRPCLQAATREWSALARYTDASGRDREIVTRAGARGSVLVVDRDLATHADRRLLAHLASDEPPENADLLCQEYLRDQRHGPRRCRALTAEDSATDPLLALAGSAFARPTVAEMPMPDDARGRSYTLELVPGRACIPELRWIARVGSADAAPAQTVSLREVVANLEHYEPTCSLTASMLALHRGGGKVSTSVLEAELVRVRESPIVLNRRLRETVLLRVEKHGQSMSEIALRCGRIKRDRKGNESGETSWLARRIGLLAEGGRSAPTRWIHSDVLALIARQGLGLSPREVEVT